LYHFSKFLKTAVAHRPNPAEQQQKTVLRHWPLPEDTELIEKVRELSLRPKPDGKYKEGIDKYFKQLRMQVNA